MAVSLYTVMYRGHFTRFPDRENYPQPGGTDHPFIECFFVVYIRTLCVQ